jgi:hypothetical protein
MNAAANVLDLAGFYLDETVLSRARARGRLDAWLGGAGDVLAQLEVRTRHIQQSVVQLESLARGHPFRVM